MSIDIEAIRERDRLAHDYYRDPADGEQADRDRAALLAYVDELSAQLRAEKARAARLEHLADRLRSIAGGVFRRLIRRTRTSARLLAHQQARLLELRAGDDWLQSRSVPELATEVKLRRAENARKDAEIGRLRDVARTSKTVFCDLEWSEHIEPEHTPGEMYEDCRRCRAHVMGEAIAAALGEEVRDA